MPPRLFLPKRSINFHFNLALETGGFNPGGTNSLPLLKPRHNTLYCTPSNRSIQFSENLLSILYPCLTSVDWDGNKYFGFHVRWSKRYLNLKNIKIRNLILWSQKLRKTRETYIFRFSFVWTFIFYTSFWNWLFIYCVIYKTSVYFSQDLFCLFY